MKHIRNKNYTIVNFPILKLYKDSQYIARYRVNLFQISV